MAIKVTHVRNKHIPTTYEIGLLDCPKCGSSLEAERKDFTRTRAKLRVGHARCPHCEQEISEASFVWTERPLPKSELDRPGGAS